MKSINFSPRKFVPILAVTVAGTFTSGCAGSSSPGTPLTNPAFVGSWSGTFTVTGSSENGTGSVVITTTGGMSGSGHDITTNQDFNINGSIDSSGTVRVNITGGITGSGSGTWAITSAGHLAGAVTTTTAAGSYTANYDLIKNPV